MAARLVPLNSNAVGPVMLQRPVLLFGRHPECDVRIDLPSISRRHCCLALAYDRITLRDLGSRNGVRVNGRLVEESILKLGDEVAIGHIVFRLDDPQPPPPPPAPPTPPSPMPLSDLDTPTMSPSFLDDDELVPLDF